MLDDFKRTDNIIATFKLINGAEIMIIGAINVTGPTGKLTLVTLHPIRQFPAASTHFQQADTR